MQPLGRQNLNAMTRLISFPDLLLAFVFGECTTEQCTEMILSGLSMLPFTQLRNGYLQAVGNGLVSAGHQDGPSGENKY